MNEDSTSPTRERIVRTAFRLFLTHGYERTSMAQLVTETGLSKGALYHHFRDKEEIREATIDHFFLRYLSLPAGEAFAARAGYADVLRHVARSYALLLQAVADITHDPLAYHRFALESAPGLQHRLNDSMNELRSTLTDAARRGQDAGTLASNLNPARIAEVGLSIVEGAGLIWSARPQGSPGSWLGAVVEDHLALLHSEVQG